MDTPNSKRETAREIIKKKKKLYFFLPVFHKKVFLGANWLKNKKGIVSDVLDMLCCSNSFLAFRIISPGQA